MFLLNKILQFGNAGMTGYLLLTCALGGVAAYSIWRGRKTRFQEALVSLFCALMVFETARLSFWDAHGAPVSGLSVRILFFSLLSLVSFYFLALATSRLDVPGRTGEAGSDDGATGRRASGESTAGGGEEPPALPNALLREMLLFGLAVAVVFVATPLVKSTTVLVIGFINAVLVGATIRIAAFAFGRATRARAMGSGAISVVAIVTVSWVLYQATTLIGERAVWWTLQTARWSDVAALAVVIAALLDGYVRWGMGRDADARDRKAEMEAAKGELAKLNKIAKDIYQDSNDLMIKQKEQALASMRKAANLEKILQMGVSIQQRRKLDDVLQMIVELVRTHLGFKTVTLRLLNEKAQSFETRAHVGLNPAVREKVVSYRIPTSEFEKMIDPRFRISKSYFIKNNTPSYGDDLAGEDSMLVENTWGEIDMLVIPLAADENKTSGYLTVETPDDTTLSLSYVIETLEKISTLAVIGIRNAQIFEELGEKDEKLKSLTDKLSSVNKLKSNFVATMSHEFRTPLTSIKAYCNTLIKNVESVDKNLLKEFLLVIDEESGKLVTLVEDILDFSQIESGTMKSERRPCNLNQVMIGAAAELAKNFGLKEISLHQDLPGDPVVVYAERDLIRQLVVSLLHNASKFCRPRGNVWMRLEEEVASARIIVEDDGIGIPEDQLEKVFDQFYQVDGSDTREHGGSGLGLALCRSVVEWHDGRIWVQNAAGGGARFVAVIPKKQAVTRSHVMNVTSTVRRLEIERFLELVVENVAELMAASKVSLMLVDPANRELRIEAAIGTQEEVVEHTKVKLGEGISGRVAAEGKPMLVKDIEQDGRVARSNNEPVYGSKSFLCVPVIQGDETVGVVNVSSPMGREEFNENDCELLELFAKRLAVALGKVEKFTDISLVYERVRDAYAAMLESMRFVDPRDNKYIAELVARVAKKLQLDKETKASLPYVLAVYDLGLSRIGNHILKKPTRLSPRDREEIENHTIIGNELLGAIEPESAVKEIVLYHHENYDGSGYPGKLKGPSIPLAARILRVADALRALISERPYQRKYTFEEAKEILKHRSGAFFDPRVADAFIEAIDEIAAERHLQPRAGVEEPSQTRAPEPV